MILVWLCILTLGLIVRSLSTVATIIIRTPVHCIAVIDIVRIIVIIVLIVFSMAVVTHSMITCMHVRLRMRRHVIADDHAYAYADAPLRMMLRAA